MSVYRAVQVSGSGDFALVERELTDPLPGRVRLRVEACGVCHSDSLAAVGALRPDPSVPIVPGHEVVGVIDALGAGVTSWQVGDRVGVGFLSGPCHTCDSCRRGDFVNCAAQPTTGTTTDGGYAEVAYARASGLVRIPDGLSSLDAAPLLCAGLTVFKALQQTGARPGELVAVQGIGGLGHLGLQYARSLGYRVAAIARGTEKAPLAAELGAEHYIDSLATDPAQALQALGGAAAIITTAANGAAMGPLVGGLAPRGRLIIVGAGNEPVPVDPVAMIFGTRTVTGSLTGSSIENEDNLRFAVRQEIRSMNEVMPLSEAPKAFAHMMSGRARFRVVLDTRG
ncbi:alcohol dehydrogenase catalytic domain-containing protein [Streptomyces sp. NPDC058691]|uniref:alcohol dehydrogenase catalytic domain-containing protein n=1 Tax=Streptomyces sp. NPDC058691 TaxID=3346601 RepID=UPI00366167D3